MKDNNPKTYVIHLNIRKDAFEAAAKGGTFRESRTNCERNVRLLLGRPLKTAPADGGNPVRPLTSFELGYNLHDSAEVCRQLAAGQLVPRSNKVVLHRGYSLNTIEADVTSIEADKNTITLTYKI